MNIADLAFLLENFHFLKDKADSATTLSALEHLERSAKRDLHLARMNQLPYELVDIHETLPDGSNPPIDARKLPLPSEPDESLDEENYISLAQWVTTWLPQARQCAPFVEEDFKDRLADAYLFPETVHVADPTLCAIIGSGPSLNKTVHLLKAFPGYILCGPSNAAILCANGINPHAIIAIDSGMGTMLHIGSAPFGKMGIHLITNPTIGPGVPAVFPSSNRWWFMSYIQLGEGAQHPYNIFLSFLFDNIKSWMYQAGCTVNAEYLIPGMWQSMGHVPFRAIYLLGADFCYRPNAARCASFRLEDDGKTWTERDIDTPSKVVRSTARLMRSRNGLLTDQAMLEYKRSLLTVWVMTQLPTFDCSDGIITEIPKVDFSLFADGKTVPKPLSEQDIVKTYNAYLDSIGKGEDKTVKPEGTPVEGALWTEEEMENAK
jgi:hypothetical protein